MSADASTLKLFVVRTRHRGDPSTAVEAYLAAEDDKQVFDWINKVCFGSDWLDNEHEGDANRRAELKAEVLQCQGTMEMEEFSGDLADEYRYSWQQIPEATAADITRLLELKIATKASDEL